MFLPCINIFDHCVVQGFVRRYWFDQCLLLCFQIRALQNDLHKNHFKATEERRIVAEIDKLNRSRRAIKEFNSVREEVDDLKMTQKELRDHRDQMFKVRTN